MGGYKQATSCRSTELQDLRPARLRSGKESATKDLRSLSPVAKRRCNQLRQLRPSLLAIGLPCAVRPESDQPRIVGCLQISPTNADGIKILNPRNIIDKVH